MGLTTFATLAALGLGTITAPAPTDTVTLAQAQPFTSTQGVAAPRGGNYMTTAQGCSYRKTQAPGYPPRWILIVNPERLGLPKPSGPCRGMR